MSDQSFDKFITNLGPMAKGIAMVMWRGSSRIAQMLKYNIAQYKSVDELISDIGPEAIDLETYDNDPIVTGSFASARTKTILRRFRKGTRRRSGRGGFSTVSALCLRQCSCST